MAGGDDDPVVRRAGRVTLASVGGDDLDPGSLQRFSRTAGRLRIDIHREDATFSADDVVQQGRVVAGAGPDLEYVLAWLEAEMLEHIGHDPRAATKTRARAHLRFCFVRIARLR